MKNRPILLLVSLFIGITLSSLAFSLPSCEEIIGMKFRAAVVIEANSVTKPWNGAKGVFGQPLAGTPIFNAGTEVLSPTSPNFCRVVLKSKSRSKYTVEIWLPNSEQWNGKYLGVGVGIAGRFIWTDLLASGLHKGYATATTNLGESDFDSDLDYIQAVFSNKFDPFNFGIGESEKVVDWAYAATHEMTLISKKIIQTFYGEKPKHSYFYGCSTGGHQGLTEAQRFPDDYDGIVSDAPGHDRTNLHMSFVWRSQALHHGIPHYFSAKKIPMLASAVLEACDEIDGIVDGVIDDPRQCEFDPASLSCKDDIDKPDCFTKLQVTALQKLYSGVKNPRTGEQLFPGLAPGAEAGLANFAHSNTYASVLAWSAETKLAKYGGEYDDKFSFDFDHDWEEVNNHLADILNSNNPDLGAYKKAGGKLIIAAGWLDGSGGNVPAMSAINYYQDVLDTMGKQEAMSVARLFVAPGVGHCSGGTGPNRFNLMNSLSSWVEEGVAPDTVMATKYIDDDSTKGVLRTRPICAYPKIARWIGEGSTDDAANFTCANP